MPGRGSIRIDEGDFGLEPVMRSFMSYEGIRGHEWLYLGHMSHGVAKKEGSDRSMIERNCT